VSDGNARKHEFDDLYAEALTKRGSREKRSRSSVKRRPIIINDVSAETSDRYSTVKSESLRNTPLR